MLGKTTRQSKPTNFVFLHRYHKSFKVAKVSNLLIIFDIIQLLFIIDKAVNSL